MKKLVRLIAACMGIAVLVVACGGGAPEGFVKVKAGEYIRGTADYPVRLSSSYYLAIHEITQAEWTEVMGGNPSQHSGDDHPVESITWYEAVDFCNRLSEAEGLTPCYAGSGEAITCDFAADGYRLPTEAEWEYAARGRAKSRKHPFAGSDDIDAVAWYSGNSDNKTHPVGRKESNSLGLYDMTGNVWEWCWDWFDRDYYPSAPEEDPRGVESSNTRALRGGGVFSPADLCPVYYRVGRGPADHAANIGFRLARTAE